MGAGRTGDGPVFVDLSNVVKDQALRPGRHAELVRWDRLQAAWMRERGAPAQWLLVADASLARALTRGEQMRLDGMRARGQLVVASDADTALLNYAVAARGTVLSNDRFVDHLKMPGLDAVSLVGWRVMDGRLSLVPRLLDRLQSVLISQRGAKQLRKELGLADDAPELGYRWFCRDAGCAIDLVALPRLQRGDAVCPTCGSFLEQGDAWRHPVWLKLMHSSDEVLRFVLQDGDRTFVGRATDEHTVALAGEVDLARDVLVLEAHYVELRNDGGKLWLTDLGGAMGTFIRHPVAGRRNIHMPAAPLPGGREVSLTPGVKVVLGRTPFTLQIAGRAGN